jgi:polyisoprenoid-binding protein YceI
MGPGLFAQARRWDARPKACIVGFHSGRSNMMNARLAVASLATLLALPVAAVAEDIYVLDPVHSQPQWSATHIGFSTQHGSFGKATGKVVLDRTAKTGTIDVTIDATSIRTYSERLDPVVMSDKFFNVDKHPTITFKSSHVIFDGDRVVGADGELTMLGVTKPVSLKVVNFVCGEQVFNKKPMCGAEATATIKRSDWGMTEGLKMSNPGDEIKLTIPVEAYLQPPQS